MSYRTHLIHRRLQIRYAMLKRDEVRISTLEEVLEWQNEVQNCHGNPLTGSVPVRYEEAPTGTDSIAECLRAFEYVGSADENLGDC